jgi:hypothetical protein
LIQKALHSPPAEEIGATHGLLDNLNALRGDWRPEGFEKAIALSCTCQIGQNSL